MKYSIITPVHNGEKTIKRNLLSVLNQSFTDWEHIVINDGSVDGTMEVLSKFLPKLEGRLRVVSHDTAKQRAVSRNDGMRAAEGEWICWLDADDYYLPYYLEAMNAAIEKYPEKKVFNFGGIVNWNNYSSTVRMSKEHRKGEEFKSGDVMSGGFIFKKECLQQTGFLPEASDPFTFGREMKLRYYEVKAMYGDKDDLGNPWGDDWAMFYMLTRSFEPQFINIAPYIVDIRGEKKL